MAQDDRDEKFVAKLVFLPFFNDPGTVLGCHHVTDVLHQKRRRASNVKVLRLENLTLQHVRFRDELLRRVPGPGTGIELTLKS
jgi:hypothetical protein